MKEPILALVALFQCLCLIGAIFGVSLQRDKFCNQEMGTTPLRVIYYINQTPSRWLMCGLTWDWSSDEEY